MWCEAAIAPYHLATGGRARARALFCCTTRPTASFNSALAAVLKNFFMTSFSSFLRRGGGGAARRWGSALIRRRGEDNMGRDGEGGGAGEPGGADVPSKLR